MPVIIDLELKKAAIQLLVDAVHPTATFKQVLAVIQHLEKAEGGTSSSEGYPPRGGSESIQKAPPGDE